MVWQSGDAQVNLNELFMFFSPEAVRVYSKKPIQKFLILFNIAWSIP
jgi:hypothetical protein